MRSINRTTVNKQHRGKWVALKGDRKTVIASGRSVKSVTRAAEKKGFKKAIITRIPKSPSSFVGYNTS